MRSSDTTIDNFLTWSFDYENLNHQVELRCWAIVTEIMRQINLKYPTPYKHDKQTLKCTKQ